MGAQPVVNEHLGDPDQFIKDNMKLVHYVAQRYYGKMNQFRVDYDDVVATGMLGLLKAYRTFDPTRGVQFSTWAVPNIMNPIGHMFRHIYRRRRHATWIGSIEEPIAIGDDGDEATIEDTIPAPDDDYSSLFVEDFISSLDEREREIVRLRAQGFTQQEVSARIYLSQVQISRILTRLAEKYRKGEWKTVGRKIQGDVEKAKLLMRNGELTLTEISIKTGVNYNRALMLKKELQQEKNMEPKTTTIHENEIGKVYGVASDNIVEKNEEPAVSDVRFTIKLDEEDSSERVEPSESPVKVNTPEPPAESLYARLTNLRTVLQGALAELDAIEQEVHDVDSAKQQLEQVRRILGVVG